MKEGQRVRHRPTGREGPIKWISKHPDVTFVYIDMGKGTAQVNRDECELLEPEASLSKEEVQNHANHLDSTSEPAHTTPNITASSTANRSPGDGRR